MSSWSVGPDHHELRRFKPWSRNFDLNLRPAQKREPCVFSQFSFATSVFIQRNVALRLSASGSLMRGGQFACLTMHRNVRRNAHQRLRHG